jgi:hypothetical protein
LTNGPPPVSFPARSAEQHLPRGLLDSLPAIPTEVPMRMIGFAVALAVSLALAPLAAETQPAGKV